MSVAPVIVAPHDASTPIHRQLLDGPFWQERNVDEEPGKASMVFVLAGAADGAYGSKPTADALIPDALVRTQPSDGG